MHIYNPKDWLTFIFKIHKSDTLRTLTPMIITIAIYSLGVAYWEMSHLKLSDKSWVKNVPIMHSLLGFAISILLVFRTNTAYDRWWEGRRLWGTLINASRSMAMKIVGNPTIKDENKQFFKRKIPLYAWTLRNHLVEQGLFYSLDDKEHPEFANFSEGNHGPNYMAHILGQKIFKLKAEGQITYFEFQMLYRDLDIMIEVCGGCERIKNTPIPHAYSAFIKKFIFLYVMTLPFGYVFALGYYVAPLVAMVFYVLASMEIIAEEIEDPFGEEANDLPITKISKNIEKHINQIFDNFPKQQVA